MINKYPGSKISFFYLIYAPAKEDDVRAKEHEHRDDGDGLGVMAEARHARVAVDGVVREGDR